MELFRRRNQEARTSGHSAFSSTALAPPILPLCAVATLVLLSIPVAAQTVSPPALDVGPTQISVFGVIGSTDPQVSQLLPVANTEARDGLTDPTSSAGKTCPSGGDTASTYSTGQPLPVSGTGAIAVTAIGASETVYDHNAQGCYKDLPDVGTRAYHGASCNANLSTSEANAYRQTGPTLNNLGPTDCKPVFSSANDRDYDHETYHEWLSSIYTSDGTNIYGLVHDEWYPSLVDRRCKPSNNGLFRIDNITLAVSNDGGATFHHPANYKLFRQGSPWSTSYSCDPAKVGSAVWGPSEPTSIVKSGGYYYTLFWQGIDPVVHNAGGICAARTADITKAGTWQVHTRRGWVDGLANLCDPLSNIGSMHGGFSYNTFLKKFLMIGSTDGNFNGYYISTSPDMVTWSAPEKVMPMNHGQISLGHTNGDGYPTLLDPTDTSMSFENTGQSPYLYMVLQPNGSTRNSLNIIRQQIHLK